MDIVEALRKLKPPTGPDGFEGLIAKLLSCFRRVTDWPCPMAGDLWARDRLRAMFALNSGCTLLLRPIDNPTRSEYTTCQCVAPVGTCIHTSSPVPWFKHEGPLNCCSCLIHARRVRRRCDPVL